jgi:hypothetical protein
MQIIRGFSWSVSAVIWAGFCSISFKPWMNRHTTNRRPVLWGMVSEGFHILRDDSLSLPVSLTRCAQGLAGVSSLTFQPFSLRFPEWLLVLSVRIPAFTSTWGGLLPGFWHWRGLEKLPWAVGCLIALVLSMWQNNNELQKVIAHISYPRSSDVF